MAKIERDRELTEEKLVNAVGELIAEDGFENLGVRKVAERAGVNKTLIYRYFDSLDGLIYAYMKKHDFWINAPIEVPNASDIRGYLKLFIRNLIKQFREDIAIRRLRRWELYSNNEIMEDIRAQREKIGLAFIDRVSQYVKIDDEDFRAITAILNAGITYLVIFEENCDVYNGINIQTDDGWEQLAKGIDKLIDIMIK